MGQARLSQPNALLVPYALMEQLKIRWQRRRVVAVPLRISTLHRVGDLAKILEGCLLAVGEDEGEELFVGEEEEEVGAVSGEEKSLPSLTFVDCSDCYCRLSWFSVAVGRRWLIVRTACYHQCHVHVFRFH